MHKTQTLLLVLLSLLAAPLAQADDAPWYEFEIVIFEYINQDNMATEVWPADPGVPVLTNAVPIDDSVKNSVTPVDRTHRVPFMTISSKDMQLTKIAEKISRSKTRHVLLHTGWLQPVYEKEKAVPVYIKGGEQFPAPVNPATADASYNLNPANPGIPATLPAITAPAAPVMLPQLEGTLTISVGRYLHVWTDLLFRRQEEAPAFNSDGSIQSQLKSYRFIDHRRMRSKEIHYIDNPAFGIIILATPYDDKAKSVEANTQ